MATAQQQGSKKTSEKGQDVTVTKVMTDAIEQAKKLVKDGESKANAAREAYMTLKKHTRKQVLHVFMAGCGLTKAGAATYYQNVKSEGPKPQSPPKETV